METQRAIKWLGGRRKAIIDLNSAPTTSGDQRALSRASQHNKSLNFHQLSGWIDNESRNHDA